MNGHFAMVLPVFPITSVLSSFIHVLKHVYVLKIEISSVYTYVYIHIYIYIIH